jgi:hypothetical protein
VTEDSCQFSITRIGTDTFRIIEQDEKRIICTWVVERKNVKERIDEALERLKVLDWRKELE